MVYLIYFKRAEVEMLSVQLLNSPRQAVQACVSIICVSAVQHRSLNHKVSAGV